MQLILWWNFVKMYYEKEEAVHMNIMLMALKRFLENS